MLECQKGNHNNRLDLTGKGPASQPGRWGHYSGIVLFSRSPQPVSSSGLAAEAADKPLLSFFGFCP
ncbi:MAG: hypothetical protein AB1585_16225 [Thermodesulfobacteriota bacterium]